MLRWVVFSVVIVILAGLATIASTLLTPSSDADPKVEAVQEISNGPKGTAEVVEPLTFNFGLASQHSDGKHTWTITNSGEGDITLRKGTSTCSCTIANLKEGDKQVLHARESTQVNLDWNTKANNGKWSQSATILVSNDSARQQLDFVVQGMVRPAITTFPTDGAVDFGTVENDTPHTREVAIFSLDRGDTTYKVEQVSNPDLLNVSIMPLSDDEIKQVQAQLQRMFGGGGAEHKEASPHSDEHNHAIAESPLKKAWKVVISIKTGAPIGGFVEEVFLSTTHPNKPKVPLKVQGKIKGPITLTPEQVRVLDVSSKAGNTQKLTVWVRGQKSTNFTVQHKPKDFGVKIEPLADATNAVASRYQLTVDIPPGLAPGDIDDEIILKTDHPRAAELKFRVMVFVKAP